MKVKINEEITVEVRVTQRQVCPAGTAYWQIDYVVDGLCIHSATTGAIYGQPDVIAMLDREYTRDETHYQDIPTPDPKPTGAEARGRKIGEGTSGNRPAWFEEITITHRQAIINAVSQIVQEG